jgi:hypothetical protein
MRLDRPANPLKRIPREGGDPGSKIEKRFVFKRLSCGVLDPRLRGEFEKQAAANAGL